MPARRRPHPPPALPQALPAARPGMLPPTILARLATLAVVLLALVTAPISSRAQQSGVAPEAATGRVERQAARANTYMVAAANPLAVAAGTEMLQAGGSAADAAIAVQLVLGLVEPQSSGLGGGAFLLHWDAKGAKVSAWDARETAPAAARPDRFLENGQPLPFFEAVSSGLSVGVPGVPHLLAAIHERHGRLPWPRLFEPAIRLAEQGFVVSARLYALLRIEGADAFAPTARTYFFDEVGSARPIGATLHNPAYASTLRLLAAKGVDAFYTGPLAQEMAAAVRREPKRPGDLAPSDLAGYRVIERMPLCSSYRERRLCGMPPPSSGGLAVAQTLALLEPFGLGRGPAEAMRPAALHLIAEAEKLAYADRDRYVADPAFRPLPDGLLDAAYLAGRRALISPSGPMARPAAGAPDRRAAVDWGEDYTVENVGTSHVSIVDADGNAIAMTTTIEGAFGSRIMVGGFLLNNQLTDFSFRPVDTQGRPVANRVEPGKRPRSTMAPTLLFAPDGRLAGVLGSPGGGRIVLYVVKALVGLVDWQLDPQAAAALPNFGSRGGPFEIELDPSFDIDTIVRPWVSRPSLWHALGMRAYGHQILPDYLTSGLHIVTIDKGGLAGGADPRREGVAAGD